MGVPSWWESRRFGLFVHTNLASVPAWAPIGQYADWYRSHLGEPVADGLLHPSPLVEVLAHHRERWSHVERFDDFWPLLTFDRFDADEWVDLARDAGMSYAVMVTKHHDGLCWWDAPGTERTVAHGGPRRDVLAELAAACERADVVLGTYYSLLDWADPRYPSDAYVDEVLHPHVIDLVERYGSRILWGDGHWGHGPDRWRSEELIARARDIQPDLVVNDRWWIAAPDVTTFEYQTPCRPLERSWELCRGIGHSFCLNRAERAEHHLDAAAIVALLTEVVAKGGHLLLNVGPAADGSIPDLQATPLRRAGSWIREHAALIDTSHPWHTWGDDGVRYLVPAACGAGDPDVRTLDVVVTHRQDHGLTALGRHAGRVTSVHSVDGATLEWHQDDTGLHVRRVDRTPVDLAAVYRVTLDPPPSAPVELFTDQTVPAPRDTVAEQLRSARPGSIVQLGDGEHRGPFDVPAGVTLRGLGADRTTVATASGSEAASAATDATVVRLGPGARLEHLTVRSGVERVAWFALPAVRLTGDGAVVIGCTVEGHVAVDAGTDEAKVRATLLAGVVATDADRVTVSRCRLRGMRWDVGVEITGGYGHLVESCDLQDHLCAIRVTRTIGANIRGNVIRARWFGVHLVDTDAAQVHANAVETTMRAVSIAGGTHAEVSGNAVADGDSGCVVERGAADCVVSGNRWERCRIGLLAWDAGPLVHNGNTAIDLHEPDHAVQIGP